MVATRNHFILLSCFTWRNYSTRVVESSVAPTLCCYHNAVLAVESSKHETSTLWPFILLVS